MSRRPHQSESTRRSRLLALPCVLLCALAYLGAAAHATLVQHGTCHEHGEAIHLGLLEEAHAPPAQEASFADPRVARASQAIVASHGAEAHCAHSFLRREALPPGAHALPAVEVHPSRGPGGSAVASQVEPIARLLLAPKASPPHA